MSGPRNVNGHLADVAEDKEHAFEALNRDQIERAAVYAALANASATAALAAATRDA